MRAYKQALYQKMSTDSQSRRKNKLFGGILRVFDQTLLKIVPLALVAMVILLLSDYARELGAYFLFGAVIGAVIWATYDVLQ
ncbi:hypothetical protein AMS69_05695 [Haloarcula rubripromontorii]|uniref:Uncharacterized protein n=1 Tax=Haloarcula rubripromontorii TaxID=1705562 RepID=A0A0M9AKP2_9EURY|nr:hypothetical protein AMS69_05695 [Haloarcula rubripromontorii]